MLVSYSGKEITDDFRRLYALAELEVLGSAIVVKNLKNVPYQTVKLKHLANFLILILIL